MKMRALDSLQFQSYTEFKGGQDTYKMKGNETGWEKFPREDAGGSGKLQRLCNFFGGGHRDDRTTS